MERLYRLGWGVALIFALLFAASMAGVVQGGPLDPPGAPAPTMKTLEEIPGTWSRQLSATGGCTSERFDCVLGDTAVLDRETGLVWERVPSATTSNWATANEGCLESGTGSRHGWRMPTAAELASLIVSSGSGLPSGHPFTISTVDLYWTATTNTAGTSVLAYTTSGLGAATLVAPTSTIRAWCVRGEE